MDEGDSAQHFARIDPNMMRAVSAMDAALDILDNASAKFRNKQYGEAIEESKLAMRFAASAVLFHDGYVASTFETTAAYIEKTYPGRFPIAGWHEAEITVTGKGPGLLNLVFKLSGQHNEKKNAEKYVKSAEKFVVEAMKLVEGLS